jgi:hypothetical protein
MRTNRRMKPASPRAIKALDAVPRSKATNYPEQNFGVNLTRLAPNAISALRHGHSRQDQFVYILEGHATLPGTPTICRTAPAAMSCIWKSAVVNSEGKWVFTRKDGTPY